MRKIATTFAVLALLAAAAPALARTLDKSSATGSRAFTATTGEISHPREISVRVSATPRQRVTGIYTLACIIGKKGSSKRGKVRGTGRFTQRLPLPRGHIRKCYVAATGQLTRGGRITVELLGH